MRDCFSYMIEVIAAADREQMYSRESVWRTKRLERCLGWYNEVAVCTGSQLAAEIPGKR